MTRSYKGQFRYWNIALLAQPARCWCCEAWQTFVRLYSSVRWRAWDVLQIGNDRGIPWCDLLHYTEVHLYVQNAKLLARIWVWNGPRNFMKPQNSKAVPTQPLSTPFMAQTSLQFNKQAQWAMRCYLPSLLYFLEVAMKQAKKKTMRLSRENVAKGMKNKQ